MNMPYYFLRDLIVMANAYRKRMKGNTGLFHQGLIQLILQHSLGKLHITWGQFFRGIREASTTSRDPPATIVDDTMEELEQPENKHIMGSPTKGASSRTYKGKSSFSLSLHSSLLQTYAFLSMVEQKQRIEN